MTNNGKYESSGDEMDTDNIYYENIDEEKSQSIGNNGTLNNN